MKLEVILKKNGAKPGSITCKREDGSLTWAYLNPALGDHDLAHYAVEKTLAYREAFFGIIASGIDIQDFEKKQSEKPDQLKGPNLPLEASQTEFIVNLLQSSKWDENMRKDFISILQKTLTDHNLPFPTELTGQKVAEIQDLYQQLGNRWLSLPEGERMTLSCEW